MFKYSLNKAITSDRGSSFFILIFSFEPYLFRDILEEEMNKEVDKVYWKFIIGILFVGAIYLYAQNYWHKITNYKMNVSKMHAKMKGKKIIFLSDTHFKENTSLAFLDRVLKDIDRIEPDIIMFGGDIIHQNNQEKVLEQTKDFFYQLNKVAPTYVVYGDQDLVSEQFSEIERVLKLSGAKVLNNEAVWISLDDSSVGFWLMGLNESVVNLSHYGNPLSKIKLPATHENEPKILLAHHPEYFEQYLANEQLRPNLILSGHTLGGQVVLPRIGGLYASGQGINPVYDFGVFTSEKYPESRMVITSGLGNEWFPLRVNNRPEIVLIELE